MNSGPLRRQRGKPRLREVRFLAQGHAAGDGGRQSRPGAHARRGPTVSLPLRPPSRGRASSPRPSTGRSSGRHRGMTPGVTRRPGFPFGFGMGLGEDSGSRGRRELRKLQTRGAVASRGPSAPGSRGNKARALCSASERAGQARPIGEEATRFHPSSLHPNHLHLPGAMHST